MNRLVLTFGLVLCGLVAAASIALGWRLFAAGTAILHVSLPVVVTAHILRRRSLPSALVQLTLGSGTGAAPAATVAWLFILYGDEPSGGAALWIAYLINAIASTGLLVGFVSAYKLLIGDETDPMVKGFLASAVPIPISFALAISLPKAVCETVLLVLAMGLPVTLLAYDYFSSSTRAPKDLDARTGAANPFARLAATAAATFACALGAGMGVFYGFNEPELGIGVGFALSGGLGLWAFALALGPMGRHAAADESEEASEVPEAGEITRGPFPLDWTRIGLAAGGGFLLLFGFVL